MIFFLLKIVRSTDIVYFEIRGILFLPSFCNLLMVIFEGICHGCEGPGTNQFLKLIGTPICRDTGLH